MRAFDVAKPVGGFASTAFSAFVLAVIGFGAMPVAPAVAANASLPPLPDVYTQVLSDASTLMDQMENAADDDCVTTSEFDSFLKRVNELVEKRMNPLDSRSDVHSHFSGWGPDAPSNTSGWTPYVEMDIAAEDLYDMLDDLPPCGELRAQLEVAVAGVDTRSYFGRNPTEFVPPDVHLPQPVEPYYHWTGLYVGAHVVGAFSTVDTREIVPFTGVVSSFLSDTGGGGGGGVDLGYNVRLGNSRWIAGVQAKLNGMSDDVTHFFDSGTSIGSTIDFSASALVNGGYLVTPRLLVFGQAGVTFADQDLHINFGGPVTDEHRFTPGFVAGVGAEYMLPRNNLPLFGKQTSLYINFDQTWYGSANLNAPAASPSFDYKFNRISSEIDLGLHVHF